MDRTMFVRHATPLMLTLGTRQVPLMPREFRTGSVGWFGNGATVIDELPVQYTITLVVKGTRGPVADVGTIPLPTVESATKTNEPLGGSMACPEGEEPITPPALFDEPQEATQSPEHPVPTPRRAKGKKG